MCTHASTQACTLPCTCTHHAYAHTSAHVRVSVCAHQHPHTPLRMLACRCRACAGAIFLKLRPPQLDASRLAISLKDRAVAIALVTLGLFGGAWGLAATLDPAAVGACASR
eukprot:6173329-Pleurochrysis_carterae.AAC.2